MFDTTPLVLALSLWAVPQALAQPAASDSGFHLRVNGDLAVAREAREGVAVVIRGNARVDGRVGSLIVIDGNATVSGGHVRELTVVRGRVQLMNGAVVENDVHLLEAEISVSDSAKVVGTIERGAGRRLARDLVGLAALVGLGVLAALVAGGVISAAVAPHLLRTTGRLLQTDLKSVALASAVVWLALPFIAVMLIPTVIGAPAGLGVFVFVLPIAWYLGLIVAGTWVGDQVLGRMRGSVEATRPFLAAALGMFLLLVLGRVSVVGLLVFVITVLGSGAAVLAAWRSMTDSSSVNA